MQTLRHTVLQYPRGSVRQFSDATRLHIRTERIITDQASTPVLEILISADLAYHAQEACSHKGLGFMADNQGREEDIQGGLDE